MDLSLQHLLLLLVIVLLLFGGRRIPELMRGLGEGIRSFREGMRGESYPSNPPTQPTSSAQTPEEKK